MGTKPGSFCLVAIELDYVVKNGGIGTTNWHLVHLLARQGWRCHVLYAYPAPDPRGLAEARRRLADAGIGFTHVDDRAPPKELRAADDDEPHFLEISDRVRWALDELHRRHAFDLIEFPEAVAPAFRMLQAQRAGSAFGGVGTIVKLHSMSQWLRNGNHLWMTNGDEVLLDYCERQAFEWATFPLSPSQHLLDYARSIGWQVRPEAQLVRYPFPDPVTSAPQWTDAGDTELVFFGRLEARKGLAIFLDALDQLDARQRVTFLGKDTVLEDGRLATAVIQRRRRGRPWTVLTDRNREQALRYLADGNRLAVLPSLLENYANAVIECVVNGIPFLASNIGGTPEIVPNTLHPHLLFAPTAPDLAAAVTRYQNADETTRCRWREQMQTAADVEMHNRQVVAAYDGMLQQVRALHPENPSSVMRKLQVDNPLVTVVVHHRNQADLLPLALRSLADQTYRHLEVHVIDDASDDPAAVKAFAEQEQQHPGFAFERQKRPGAWAGRNRILAETAGEFYLALNADTVLRPALVEHLVQALRAQLDCAAMACYLLGIAGPADLAREEYASASRPVGGPLLMGSLQNVWGEGNGLYRTAELRAIGGFVAPAPDTTDSDWPTYARLACGGRAVGVLPEHLGYRLTLAAQPHARSHNTHLQVLELYRNAQNLSDTDRLGLWTALASFYHQQNEQLRTICGMNQPLRYRLVDQANTFLKKVPLLHPLGRAVVAGGWSAWRRVRPGERDA